MNIQAHLYFTESAVTCVPVHPDLSGYRDRVALDDAALTFRMRLFGARVRMDAAAARVALVLPRDCVMQCAEGADFGDIPEDELHIIGGRSGMAARRLAVECSAFDEVIAFAKSYGLKPVCVMIPDPDSDGHISLPLADEDSAGGRGPLDAVAEKPCASVVAMPPALERELAKRKQLEDRKSARVTKGWALSKLIRPSGEADGASNPEVRTETALPPAAPITHGVPQVADLPAMPAPLTAPVQDQPPVAEAEADAPKPDIAAPPPVETGHKGTPEIATPLVMDSDRDARVEDARITAEKEGKDVRPRPAVAVGLAAALGLVAIVGPLLYQGGPDTATEVGEIAANAAGQVRTPAVADTVTVPAQGVAPTNPQEVAAPQAAALPVMISGSSSAPHARPVPERPLASAEARRSGAPVIVMAAPEAISTPRISTLPAVSAGPNGVLNIDESPTRSAVAFPDAPALDQIEAPQVLTGASGGVRLLAAQRNAPAEGPVAQQSALRTALAPPPPAQPRVQGVSPQPRPIAVARAAAPQAPQAPVNLTTDQAATAGLGPDRAPRPLLRPGTIAAQAQTARVETARATTPAALSAPAATPPLADTALGDIPRGSVPGLRVLAIVGSGDQRQALVETGPNQTAVLVAGAATRRWQVIEVRREGVVLWIDGGQRLLPIGL